MSSLLKWIAVLLALLGLSGVFGCSQVARNHWANAGNHLPKALDHTGGVLVESGKAIWADGVWLIESGGKLIPLIP